MKAKANAYWISKNTPASDEFDGYWVVNMLPEYADVSIRILTAPCHYGMGLEGRHIQIAKAAVEHKGYEYDGPILKKEGKS